MAFDLLVDRADLARTTLVEVPEPEPGLGEAVLRVDRVAVTANNVTYAVLGEAMRYWEFFPSREGTGRVPLWGFGDVVASRADDVPVGTRVYGYFPSSSHLVVQPQRVDERGFDDGAAHRAGLPGVYNAYTRTTGDPAYEAAHEDLLALYRPLFWTSFLLADALGDLDVEQVVLSSASSRTAYGAAHLLQTRTVGLTGQVGFTQELGCYDEVLDYDALPERRRTAYVDLSGRNEVRERLREHLADLLEKDLVVGLTAQEPVRGGEVFFAPTRMQQRQADWGHAELGRRFHSAWRSFLPLVEQHTSVQVARGGEGLQGVWDEVVSGRADPRHGHVVAL